MNKQSILISAVSIFASIITATPANAAWYPYLGVSAGQATFDDICSGSSSVAATSCEDSDISFKVYAGAKIGRYLAFELAYIDMGEQTITTSADEFKISASGINASAFGILPVTNNIDLFAKAGVISWQAENRSSTQLVADSKGADVSYGAGLNVGISRHLAIRAEYEIFQRVGGEVTTGESPVTLISMGIAWYF